MSKKAELAVIVPTRGRPANLNRVIGAWDFTNAWDVADLIVVVDADDPEIRGYRDAVNEILDNVPDGAADPIRLIEHPEWMPMVHKLDAAATALAVSGKYFALGFAGDDHLPQTIGWAETYLTALRELGTGMVYGDDGYQGKKLATEWAVTADVVRTLGRMVPAPVEHLYCDNAMMDLFDAAGAMRHLPQVRIEHMHPAAGKAASDDQYQRVNSRAQYAQDRDRYQSWKNGKLSEQLAVLRALRPGRLTRSFKKEARTMSKTPFPHHFKQVRGATPPEIEVTLADLALRVPMDQEIVELGVFQGKTALVMAWGARQGAGAHVTGIDAWDLPGNTYDAPFTDEGSRRWARYWVQNLGYANHIELIHAFSHDVAASWSGKPIGLLFVDADHSYEGARRDIEDWAPYLAPDAVIAVDDYGHPDWPGVKQAVDKLVDEGFLTPVVIYHERLAVTALTGKDRGKSRADGAVTAITSDGVSPSPKLPDRDTLEAEWEKVDPEGVARVDSEVSGGETVQAGELEDIPAGTRITDLNTVQLRALAKARGISLGARKDKRSEMLQALRDGQ
jgi:predicted O-methyltransferase YrrM